MCYRSSYDYDRRLGTDATRSFFQALRDLFRRTPRPQAEAEVVPLPAAATADAKEPAADRAKAA